ncbi:MULTISPECIES: hypothetical protein [Okeania]|uniref:hypothetical protein n=1 Tax=Okeania TaxID=1458928 RepID=UPI000F537516|nr:MULTISPECIES: hypothetical protein [Okeania]NEP03602.1 hypothetical protein [Okeania sp. SIO4D6]NET18187.1 hypothetical protein [Okeania sp. SIO1H5]NEP72738.1 hypothetical protein [Okeania sp. SIO2G5]NEP93372.1 hypothetical protein [Okeania sp. SIO2F5]NEQ91384.1 hypothetical protein [Okeania sp. SIO2G4]
MSRGGFILAPILIAEGRGKKEEGRRKREEGRKKNIVLSEFYSGFHFGRLQLVRATQKHFWRC